MLLVDEPASHSEQFAEPLVSANCPEIMLINLLNSLQLKDCMYVTEE